jgi:nicotinamidase-related amidase
MENSLQLNLQSQSFMQDANAYSVWQVNNIEKTWSADKTALLLCDVWDLHWCRGACERLEAMVGRMDQVVMAVRDAGGQIVHAPSDTMDFYAESPARKRAIEAPQIEPPPDIERADPSLPIDDSDQGSDTGETETHKAWHRQHAAIGIDEKRDIISDKGTEVYSYLQQRGIEHLLIMGVHTNMCVLHRTFAIKQMVRWGMDVALIRDLTDAMYNPAMPPYVSHAEGTGLVIEFIEKFWCPSVESGNILGAESARNCPFVV